MNKCPYCSSDIQEGAQFCLYCMKPLNEKKDITPKKKTSLLPVIIAAAVILAALSVTALIFAIGMKGKNNTVTDTNKEKQETSEETKVNDKEKETEEQKTNSPDTEKPEDGVEELSFFDDVQLRATFLTGKNGLSHLWNPDSFVLTHTKNDSGGDLWEIYSPDVYLDGVYVSVSVCADGENVLTTVSGIIDETLDDALLLCECLVSSVCNYTYDNLSDLLRDKRKYPMSAVEDGVSLAALAEMKDPEAVLFDKDSEPLLERMSIDITEDGVVDMFYDKRTRTYKGETYYDIYFLHFSE